jgi:hypothetical protein
VHWQSLPQPQCCFAFAFAWPFSRRVGCSDCPSRGLRIAGCCRYVSVSVSCQLFVVLLFFMSAACRASAVRGRRCDTAHGPRPRRLGHTCPWGADFCVPHAPGLITRTADGRSSVALLLSALCSLCSLLSAKVCPEGCCAGPGLYAIRTYEGAPTPPHSLSLYLSIYLSFYLSISLCVCVCVCASVCLCVCCLYGLCLHAPDLPSLRFG